MYQIGIDIGTTTISAAVLDPDDKTLKKACNVANNSAVAPQSGDEREQLPEVILQSARTLLDSLLKEFPETRGIGLTGQMHGILYIDAEGEAVSPLYTWQDRRAERFLENGNSYSQQLSGSTGYRIPAGYGLATHYYLSLKREIPARAVAFCTIADYIAMRLTGRTRPIIHASNAASIGGFDLRALAFDRNAIRNAGLDLSFLPEVSDGEVTVGEYRGIPVHVAVGDNQASFLGAVGKDEKHLLINLGTGSQISAVTQRPVGVGSCEIRPFVDKKYLIVGAAQCGGRAYAMLADLFRTFVEALGVKNADIYGALNAFAARSSHPLEVDTCFAGTAEHPELRGSIRNIGIDQLNPADLSAGFLYGMAEELHRFYREFGQAGAICTRITASGNAVRKNPLMQRILSERFGMPCTLSPFAEEAACGAALLC